MVFEKIEKIKRQYTDKYVMVDGKRPELARFRELVGQVKTINMSGRALVEFQDYHLNISWFDIDLDYLKVVDKPSPKQKTPVAKKAGTKTTAQPDAQQPAPTTSAKKLSPLEMARQADSANKPKTSTADVLSAARGELANAPSDSESAGTAKSDAATSAADKGAPAKSDRSKMSVADVLAAARGEAAAAASGPKSHEASPPAEPEPTLNAPVSDMASQDSTDTDSVVRPVDRSVMSIDEMIAYCRTHDA
ncbi:MAG: hypothetical protein MK171_02995 [Pirellulales bacterium]|nr:hypothetical protein [Pirellulales bacterium]